MADTREPTNSEIERLNEEIKKLERRVSLLEDERKPAGEYYEERDSRFKIAEPEVNDSDGDAGESFLESTLGEYGLAWMGNIVLLFAMTFLTGYLQVKNLPGVSAITGYLAVIAILYISNRTKDALSYLSELLRLNGHFLLFYVTLRLHFFTDTPLISSVIPGFLLLIVLLSFQTYRAIKRNSQLFFGMVLTELTVTALATDSTHMMLPLLVLVGAGGVGLMILRRWRITMIFSLVLVYMSFLGWFLGNPVAGHPVKAITSIDGGIIYLFMAGAIYSVTGMLHSKGEKIEELSMAMIIMNMMSFTTITGLLILQFFREDYNNLMFVITAGCLSYSVVLQKYSEWKFAPAFYALYGFTALSVALYGLLGKPDVFFALALQSMLVVSMALWFKNKIIVFLNAVMVFFLLILYFIVADSVNSVNIAFSVVAILTARILNWQKERLEIETEFLRNFYLITGFFLVLFTLYHLVPGQFVTLSWTIAAVSYLGISILLKKRKYRYMALGTLLATAFYLFIIDLAKIDLVYRILAFLFLSVISIVVSIYYTRRKTPVE